MNEGRRMVAILNEHYSSELAPEHAFVECAVCGRKTREEGSAGITDEELTTIFESRGWTVRPTRCPEHVGVEVE